MTLLDRQKEWVGYLAAGFPEYDLPGLPLMSAIAAVANCTQENLCNPVTLGPKDHGSDGGFQWRKERLEPGPDSLKGWAAANHQPWNTIRTQAAFFIWELKHGDAGGSRYDALYAELLAGQKPLATLTTNINRSYERSADDDVINRKRIKYANDLYVALKGAPPKLSPAVTGAVVIGTAAGGVAGGQVATGQATASPGLTIITAVISLISYGVAALMAVKSKPTVVAQPDVQIIPPAVTLTPMEEFKRDDAIAKTALIQRQKSLNKLKALADEIQEITSHESVTVIDHTPAVSIAANLGAPVPKIEKV